MCRNYQRVADAYQEWPSPGIALPLHAIPRDLLVGFQLVDPMYMEEASPILELVFLVPVDTNGTITVAGHASESLRSLLNIQILRAIIFIDGAKEAFLFTSPTCRSDIH